VKPKKTPKLTKSPFIERVSQVTGYHPKTVWVILRGVAQVLREMVLDGDHEHVRSPLGTFYQVTIKERRVRDIHNNPDQWLQIPAKRLVRLRPSKMLQRVLGVVVKEPPSDD
jgi:nucleoid DNA-binding protein